MRTPYEFVHFSLSTSSILHMESTFFYFKCLKPQRDFPKQWSEFLTTDPEVRVGFPALQDFIRSSGSRTGSTQPREYNLGAT
jgi:hypothetical protein